MVKRAKMRTFVGRFCFSPLFRRPFKSFPPLILFRKPPNFLRHFKLLCTDCTQRIAASAPSNPRATRGLRFHAACCTAFQIPSLLLARILGSGVLTKGHEFKHVISKAVFLNLEERTSSRKEERGNRFTKERSSSRLEVQMIGNQVLIGKMQRNEKKRSLCK